MLLVQMVGDGLHWVSEFLRLIVITGLRPGRGVTTFTLIPPNSLLGYYCYHIIYRLSGDTEWLTNLSEITQPEVVESQFEPRVSGSRIHDSGYFAIMHCVISESYLVTWCPKLESEPSFNLCFVWSLLVMI